ncbi:MAG: BamA/TamA family outer membrane protein, partial [Rhodothermales bacterium]
RYTQFEGIRIQDQILSWLKNAGFAFASVQRQADVDSSANTVDLRFVVNPGPRGYISEIQIDGVESVEPRIVRRELPFRVGDRYSAADVARGQQELFEMNLFRVVISELPEQPEDSTVVVRYRLREARPRNVSAQTGYGLDEGGQVEARWSHRNFMGAARQLTASGVYSSGYGAAPAGGFGASRRKSVSLRLNQPYLFTRRLSGAIAPSYVRGEVPSLNLRYEEAELNTAVIYSIYNFRTITFSHSLSRARPLGDREDLRIPTLTFDTQESFDVFNQNVFSLSANLGNVDNYLQPTSGFLIRPRVEMGGVLVQLKDDVDYYKVQSEFVGYLPLGEDYTLSGRLYVGNIWPIKESRSQVADPQIEFRFDRIRYYAGGANDVRGWPSDLLGPKVPAVKRDTAGTITEYAVEPWGGLGKIAANIELRTPVPWLGSSWKGAVFLDMAELLPSDAAEERIRRIPLNEFRFGTGVGLRYQTMVGFIRLDLGYKVNPSIQDLASPREIFELREGLIGPSDVDTNIWDRLRLHLSIGQSF